MKKVALIVAGGKGERMNSEIPKQFLLLHNVPILIHTLKKFSHFEKIVLVLPKVQFNYWNKICQNSNLNGNYTLVEGGKNRFHSVKNGLKKVQKGVIVVIHDGVRPLISKNLIDRLVAQNKKGTGVIPIMPIKSSIRKIYMGKSNHIDRRNIYHVQTPQCFISTDIKNAYELELVERFTDDASVLENAGGKITTISGEEKNIKITTAEDLKIAELFMQ